MQIFVQTLNGEKSIKLNIKPSDTIEHLKVRIQEKLAITLDCQRLTFAGRPLRNDRTLADHGVHDRSIVFLVPRLLGGSGQTVSISFKSLASDRIYQLEDVRPAEHLVGQLKERIVNMIKQEVGEEANISTKNVRLLRPGEWKQLDDKHTLQDNRVEVNSDLPEVPLVLRSGLTKAGEHWEFGAISHNARADVINKFYCVKMGNSSYKLNSNCTPRLLFVNASCELCLSTARGVANQVNHLFNHHREIVYTIEELRAKLRQTERSGEESKVKEVSGVRARRSKASQPEASQEPALESPWEGELRKQKFIDELVEERIKYLQKDEELLFKRLQEKQKTDEQQIADKSLKDQLNDEVLGILSQAYRTVPKRMSMHDPNAATVAAAFWDNLSNKSRNMSNRVAPFDSSDEPPPPESSTVGDTNLKVVFGVEYRAPG